MTFTFEDPLVRTWAFHAVVLLVKMTLMSPYTGFTRMRFKAFANPEDGAPLKVKPRVDENVERIRRAHLNDLENIPTFIAISFIYILTNPSVAFATMLFRIATAGRLLHTFVYAVWPLPQPSRAIAAFMTFGVALYMGVQSLVYFM